MVDVVIRRRMYPDEPRTLTPQGDRFMTAATPQRHAGGVEVG